MPFQFIRVTERAGACLPNIEADYLPDEKASITHPMINPLALMDR